MDDFFQPVSNAPGLRLHKLEMLNWGTFDSSDGRVFTIEPRGRTTLAVGENGTGKSTLSDALLTLLVRQNVRSYNVAAASAGGTRKRDRNPRTYVRGAYDHGSDGEKTTLQFLRKGAGVYSVLLAYFDNADIEGAGFTVAQVLYLTADDTVDYVYAFAEGEKSIAGDLSGIKSFDRLRQRVEDRGFRATKTFTHFEKWLFKAARLRPKAMDIFNQTVAVKDIVSLNNFIRQHMLEKHSWGEEIERILAHFLQLSEAYRLLVKTREQLELLKPIVRAAERYGAASGELARLQDVKRSVALWFCHRKVRKLTPLIAENEGRLASQEARKLELEKRIEDLDDKIRHLKNEMEQAGGPRLKELPALIREAESVAAQKRAQAGEFVRAASSAGIEKVEIRDSGPRDEAEFDQLRGALKDRAEFLSGNIPKLEAKKTGLSFRRMQKAKELDELRIEIEALRQRRTALPERFAQLRRVLCESLHLPEKELPFAAELITVKAEERDWENSIEMVLRGFALSLLVPENFYHQVSSFIDRSRLTSHGGEGQRLVYFRVGESEDPIGDRQHGGGFSQAENTLPGKLDFRPNHRLTPWVKSQMEARFQYLCCDTIEEFQRHRGDALTAQRHVKNGRGKRHEKDDRSRATNRANFVLGWDNREKLKYLIAEMQKLEGQQVELDRGISQLDSSIKKSRDQETAANRAIETVAFHSLDHRNAEEQVAELRREEEALRSASQEMRDLDQRLDAAKTEKSEAQRQRDAVVTSLSDLKRDLDTAREMLAEADAKLAQFKDAPRREEHFEEIEKLAAESDLENPLALDKPEQSVEAKLAEQIDAAREKVDPLRDALTDRIVRFLNKITDLRADLGTGVDSIPDYLRLHDRIVRDDLPSYEDQFRERLNDKASKEIAVLNARLAAEAREIKGKIGLLNDALRSLDYENGKHMQLEAQDVRDPEIIKFRMQLRECLADSFDTSMQANEARFKRIEKLIADLRGDQRYRERVTDVRRWFNFFACVIDNESGGELSRYSDGSGRSGGEKSKLAFTILVAAITYQYQIDPRDSTSEQFHFVVVDEMFAKMADEYSIYALELFKKLRLQLLIVAPLDAKARITEDYVNYYVLVTKDSENSHSELFTMSAEGFRELELAESGG